jgi:hypothetical protein
MAWPMRPDDRTAARRRDPVEQSAGERSVGEDEPRASAQVILQQGRLDAVAVLHRGGDDHDGEQQTECVAVAMNACGR